MRRIESAAATARARDEITISYHDRFFWINGELPVDDKLASGPGRSSVDATSRKLSPLRHTSQVGLTSAMNCEFNHLIVTAPVATRSARIAEKLFTENKKRRIIFYNFDWYSTNRSGKHMA